MCADVAFLGTQDIFGHMRNITQQGIARQHSTYAEGLYVAIISYACTMSCNQVLQLYLHCRKLVILMVKHSFA